MLTSCLAHSKDTVTVSIDAAPLYVDVNIGKLPSRRAVYLTKQGALSLLPAVAFRVAFFFFVLWAGIVKGLWL